MKQLIKKILAARAGAHATAVLALAMLAPAAAAQEGLFYIDFERVYRESTVVQQVRDAINADFADREEKLRQQGDSIREMTEERDKETLTLTDQELESKNAEIDRLQRNFVRDRRALVEDRGVEMNERRRLIDIEIATVIEALAREREARMVINPYLTLPISGNRTLTHNIILFAAEDADLTSEVIERFDAGATAEEFIK